MQIVIYNKQAQERAGEIQTTQIPGISAEVEALRQEVEPLKFRTQQGIQSGIMTPAQAEENYLKSLNNLYIAQQVGLGANIQPDTIQYSNNILQTPIVGYNRPEDLGTATQSSIDQAKIQYDRYNNFLNQKESIDKSIRDNERELRKAENSVVDPYDITGAIRKAQVENELRGNIENLTKQKETLFSQSSGIDVSKVPIYQQYLNRINKSRQELLKEYDPSRLARINALSQHPGIR